jgi:hypothetical protein
MTLLVETRQAAAPGASVGLVIHCHCAAGRVTTASDYGVTIGFRDRTSFDTVEPLLRYYGPWFQMLIAWVQLWAAADPLTIRHALTFAAESARELATSSVAVDIDASPFSLGLSARKPRCRLLFARTSTTTHMN